MSIEATLALIASITSLAVAAIGLVSSIITRRQTARADEKIETLRFEFSRKEAAWALGDEQLTQSLESLRLAIQAIQRVKDELQLILAARETSLDSDTALERLNVARTELFACYETELACLDDVEAKACHQAKNLSLIIEHNLRECLSGKSQASQLSGEDRQRLQEFRSDLTDCQQRLRDCRTNRLIERMSRGQQSTQQLGKEHHDPMDRRYT